MGNFLDRAGVLGGVLCWSQVIWAFTYRPGLMQAKFASSTADTTNDILASTTAERVPGTIMADTTGSASNTFGGASWTWNSNTTYGYAGWMWMEAGRAYIFGKQFDDRIIVTIDGTTILDNSTWDAFAVGSNLVAATGWHAVDIRLYNGGGGVGPCSGNWSGIMGLAWNTNGLATSTPLATWAPLRDTGDMTLFRCNSAAEAFATLQSVTKSGSSYTFRVTVSNATASSIIVYSGATSGGIGDGASWAVTNSFPGGAADGTYVIDWSGTGDPWFCVRVKGFDAVLSQPFDQWLDPAQAIPNPVLAASLGIPVYDGCAFSAVISYLGVGASRAQCYLEVSTAADFSVAPAFSAAVGPEVTTLPATFSFAASGLASNTVYFARVTVTNDVASSAVSQTFTFRTRDAAGMALTDLFTVDHAAGEKILLKEAPYGMSYVSQNPDVAAFGPDGRTITLVAPGAAPISVLGADGGISNTQFVVSLPRPIGSGKVYVLHRANASGSAITWRTAAWSNATDGVVAGYPDGAADTAFIVAAGPEANLFLPDSATTTLAALDVCFCRIYGSASVTLCGENAAAADAAKATLAFARADGAPVCIRLTGGLQTRSYEFRLGSNGISTNCLLNVHADSDIVLDFGGTGGSAAYNRGNFSTILGHAILALDAGRVFTVSNTCDATVDTVLFTAPSDPYCFRMPGIGTFRNVSRGTVSLNGDYRDFDFRGTFLETAFDPDRTGDYVYHFVFGVLPSNTAVSVLGNYNTNRLCEAGVKFNPEAAPTNPGCSFTPPRMRLESGSVYFGQSSNKKWGADVWATNDIHVLTLAGGASVLSAETAYAPDSDAIPRVRKLIRLRSIVREDPHATLLLRGLALVHNTDSDKQVNLLKGYYTVDNFDSLAVGAGGNGVTSTLCSIVPWLVTSSDQSWTDNNNWGLKWRFASATNDIVVYNTASGDYAGIPLETALTNDDANVVYASNNGISLTNDHVVNSLVYETTETPPYDNHLQMGAGRTITIKSGGLIMSGSNKWLDHALHMDNAGRLVFLRTAYVFASGAAPVDSSTDFDTIFSAMTATNDWVKSGPGHLVIAGDQRGIGPVVYVEAGTLWLGHPDRPGWLHAHYPASQPGACTSADFDVRPGATLAIARPGYPVGDVTNATLAATAVISLHGNSRCQARMLIDAGCDQAVHKLYINGVSQSRGDYTATLDPLHFAGGGVLHVARDDYHPGFYIIVQ